MSSIAARAPPDAIAATNPVIVVEVLSPTTQAIDTSDKLADYFRFASIQHYLIVSACRHEIIHHQRAGDAIASRIVNLGSIHLDPPGIAIDVADIYAGLGQASAAADHATTTPSAARLAANARSYSISRATASRAASPYSRPSRCSVRSCARLTPPPVTGPPASTICAATASAPICASRASGACVSAPTAARRVVALRP